MNVFPVLHREHRQIRLVIDAILALLDGAPARRSLEVAPFLALEAFSLRFADGAHHQREEQVLFAELARAGLPPTSGPLGEKHSEHEQARKYAAVAGAAARALQAGDLRAEDELRAAARAWAELSARHLIDEERFLFPLALRVIPAQRLAQLGAEMAAADPVSAREFAAAAATVVEAAVAAAAHGRRAG